MSRIVKVIAVISFSALVACGPTPDETACNDFRVMTIYDNGHPPMMGGFWGNAETKVVCVVSERRITRDGKPPAILTEGEKRNEHHRESED